MAKLAPMHNRHVIEELHNISINAPLWPGDTVSHDTANECGKRGWATRDSDGNWVPTELGRLVEEAIQSKRLVF